MKKINFMKDCEIEILDFEVTMGDIELCFPRILFKYEGKTILNLETGLEYIKGKKGNYTRLDILIKTNIGNIIKNDIAFRRTPYAANFEQNRKGLNKDRKDFSFQIESLNFKRNFTMFLNLIFSYYKNKGTFPTVCCYQRVTGNSVQNCIDNNKEPEYELFYVDEFIEKYKLKDLGIKPVKTIKLHYDI